MLRTILCSGLYGLAVLALASSAAAAQGAGQLAASAAVEQTLERVFKPWSAPGTPGCVVALEQGGHVLSMRAYGRADLERDVSISPETVFEIGSNSKQFTAAAVLMLAQDGRLSLEDDVRKHVPELPAYGDPINIAHLLHHTSGLRDWGEIAALQGWPRTTRAHTNQDALDIIVRQRFLNHRPGDQFAYTNSGYVLLAIIAERVSGKSLPAFTHERIFRPLGMNSTSWRDDHNRVVKGRAIAYWKKGDQYSQLMPFEDVYGPGGVLSTAGDLLRWNRALDRGDLGPSLTLELQREGRLNDGSGTGYARGVFVGEYKGTRMISHGGTTGAYQANLTRYPDVKLSFVLLCNDDDVPTRDIEDQIIDAVVKPRPAPHNGPAAAPRVSLAPQALAKRAGVYLSDQTGLVANLAMDKEALRWGNTVMEPLSESEFRTPSRAIRFESNGTMVSVQDGSSQSYRKVQGKPASPAELAALRGRYSSPEVGVAYLATVEDGKLTLRNEARPSLKASFDAVGRDVFRYHGTVVRVERGQAGHPSALVFSVPRIRALAFRREPEPRQPPTARNARPSISRQERGAPLTLR